MIAGKVFKFQLILYGNANLRTSQEELRSLLYNNMSLKDLPLRTLVSHCLRISSCFSMIVVSEIWEYRVTIYSHYQMQNGKGNERNRTFFLVSSNQFISRSCI